MVLENPSQARVYPTTLGSTPRVEVTKQHEFYMVWDNSVTRIRLENTNQAKKHGQVMGLKLVAEGEGRIVGKDPFGWFIVWRWLVPFATCWKSDGSQNFNVLPCMALNSLEVGREICCVLM